MSCRREWQPLISSHSWACIYREIPALKLTEESVAWFSSLSSSVGWNSSFLRFLAPAYSALHLQFTGSCYSRMSWQLNTHIQMCESLLGSTLHDQEVQELLFTSCPFPDRNTVLIIREGNSLSRIPPKSQHLILLHSLMRAHLLFTAVRWVPDDPSKTSRTDYPPIPAPARNKNEKYSQTNTHTPQKETILVCQHVHLCCIAHTKGEARPGPGQSALAIFTARMILVEFFQLRTA